MDDLRGALPLNPRVFAILVALSAGASHGYAIRKAVRERSEKAIRLDPGSLYRTIARLEEDGWIAETDERPDPEDDDPRRRYYELTPLGRRVLSAETERLAALVGVVRGLPTTG